mmetsp:Transcript_20942/g.59763  ORF Transcript_20942/g.59763 Transcript_20942/m.59763 type:complete len:259 (+) Transcript_20942:212-988(+)
MDLRHRPGCEKGCQLRSAAEVDIVVVVPAPARHHKDFRESFGIVAFQHIKQTKEHVLVGVHMPRFGRIDSGIVQVDVVGAFLQYRRAVVGGSSTHVVASLSCICALVGNLGIIARRIIATFLRLLLLLLLLLGLLRSIRQSHEGDQSAFDVRFLRQHVVDGLVQAQQNGQQDGFHITSPWSQAHVAEVEDQIAVHVSPLMEELSVLQLHAAPSWIDGECVLSPHCSLHQSHSRQLQIELRSGKVPFHVVPVHGAQDHR